MSGGMRGASKWMFGLALSLLSLVAACESSSPTTGGGGGGGCIPSCAGRSCGDDGCGGLCGSCGPDTYCNAGACVSGACTPQCQGRSCGGDGCGGLCGTCGAGTSCQSGTCVASGPTCTDQCSTTTCEDTANVAKCAIGASGCKEVQIVACSGGQICKNGTCGKCTASQDCPEQSVCGAGACKNYSGVKYRFTISAAKVPEKDLSGASWDALGGLPDPFVCLYVGGEQIGCTTAKDDTTSASWTSAKFEASVYEGDTLGFEVLDEDASANDLMGGGGWPADVVPDVLRAGGGEAELFVDGADEPSSALTVTWSVEAL